MKKLIIFSAILLAVVLIFLGIYNVVFKKTSLPSGTASQNMPASATPTAGTGNTSQAKTKIYAVSDQAVLGPFFNKTKQKLTYYSAADGTVWQSDPDGSNKTKTEATTVSGIENVQWSPDGSSTLAQINNSYYEFNHLSNVG